MNVQNGEPHLREAIDSVVAQTLPDWELILWDDHSTDESAAIVASYQDQRIRYFFAPRNTLLGTARKLAMRQASGEWLAFLDQDDIWYPDKLEKQMARIDAMPDAGLIYGRTVVFSESGQQRDFDHRHEYQALPEGDIFERLFVDSCFISMSSAAIRRSVLDDIEEIPDAYEIIPDYYLFVEVARRRPAAAVQDVVCRYRVHALNMSHSSRGRMHREVLQLIERCSDDLPAPIVRRRQHIHATVLAWDELHDRSTLLQGSLRLVREGSLVFLFTRPFARLFRSMRRIVQAPYWKKHG